MRLIKWLRIIGAIAALVGVVGAGLKFTLNTTIIVALGIRVASFLTTAAYSAAGIGSTLFALSFLPKIQNNFEQIRETKMLRDKNDAEYERTADYEADSLNPEKVRDRLVQLQDCNPYLEDLMENCIHQKDDIDRYQERLDRLLRANNASYLDDIVGILDKTEQRICANFRDIINCCLLVEYNGEDLSASSKEIVKSSLQNNQEELEAVKILLDRSVSYINDFNRKGIDDRSELDAWIKTMERKINNKGELTLD